MLSLNIGRAVTTALLGAALVVGPVFVTGCSSGGEAGQERAETKEASLSEDSWSPEAMVDAMSGLTDDERTELVALYKQRSDTQAEGGTFPYADQMRILVLEHKDLIARARENGNASEDQIAELEGLLASFDALPENEYLDHDSWDRLLALQATAGGYQMGMTNAETAAECKGLTDEEREELCDLLYQSDQDATRGVVSSEDTYTRLNYFWELDRRAQIEEALGPDAWAEYVELSDAFAALGEGEYLDNDSWDRLMELEAEAGGYEFTSAGAPADELQGLTDEERAEAADFFYKSAQDGRRGTETDYSSYDRLQYFYEVDRKSRMEANLGSDLYAEYVSLSDELKALPVGQYVDDETWDRIQYLEFVGSGEEGTFMTESEQVAAKSGLTDAEKEELAGLYYHRDQDWFRDGTPTDADIEAIATLEEKATTALAQERLSAEEYEEYAELVALSRSGKGLDDEQWMRLSELSGKVYGEGTPEVLVD